MQKAGDIDSIVISAERGAGFDELKNIWFSLLITPTTIQGSNSRHHNELQPTLTAILSVRRAC